ncbi:MAG: LLM class flavin-dependent oxidoreductase [Burkholderiales bacterium]|nr:LLM class flavin-dependent oxidoreductase [Burkholderiales bacterium]
MKIGVAIPPKLTLTEQVALARDCDAQGCSLWMPDERFFRDVFVAMTSIALATRTALLGTGVTDPYIRHPLLTAAAIATLDEAAQGRAILGLGAGVSGFDALGIQRIAPATAVREMIDLCRRFWAGESVDHQGRHAFAKGARLSFPARDIPIYIAGRGAKILAAGGELAAGVIIGHFTSAPGIGFAREHIDVGLRRRAPERARPELALWAYTSVSRDGDAARAAVKPAIGRTIRSTPESLDILQVRAPALLAELEKFGYARTPEYDAAMRGAVADELTTHLSIAGTPAECVARIRAIRDCGVEHVIVLPYPAAGMPVAAMLELFTAEVLPHVRTL